MQTIHVPVKYSQTEVIEFAALCEDFIRANPKASREQVIAAVESMTDVFNEALRLRYNLPQLNQ